MQNNSFPDVLAAISALLKSRSPRNVGDNMSAKVIRRERERERESVSECVRERERERERE